MNDETRKRSGGDANEEKDAQKKPPAESTSFEALQAELGKAPAPSGEAQPGQRSRDPGEKLINPETGAEEVPDPEVEARLSEMLGEDEGRIRQTALTGSAAKGTPVWMSGLFTGVLSLALVYLAANYLGAFQPMISYSILIISVGTILWTGYGFAQGEESNRDRYLCFIGLALGALATWQAIAIIP